MSGFTNDTFATVGAHSADTPTVWAYYTTDTKAQVQGNNYFREKKFQIEEGDIVYIQYSDVAEGVVPYYFSYITAERILVILPFGSPNAVTENITGTIVIDDRAGTFYLYAYTETLIAYIIGIHVGQTLTFKCVDDTFPCWVRGFFREIDNEADGIQLHKDESVTVQFTSYQWRIL